MTEKSAARNAKYAVTPMQRGGFRAECFIESCHWWRDFETESIALDILRRHMRDLHRVGVKTQTARAGT